MTQMVARMRKYKSRLKMISLKDFSGEKIKIAARYWARTIKTILYPLTTDSRLKNLKKREYCFLGLGF